MLYAPEAFTRLCRTLYLTKSYCKEIATTCIRKRCGLFIHRCYGTWLYIFECIHYIFTAACICCWYQNNCSHMSSSSTLYLFWVHCRCYIRPQPLTCNKRQVIGVIFILALLYFTGLLIICLWHGVMKLQMNQANIAPLDFLLVGMCRKMDKHAMPV